MVTKMKLFIMSWENFCPIVGLALATILQGCSSMPLPKTVKVPIAVSCPTPEIPKKPLLPISDLENSSSPNTVIKAYAASVSLLQNYTTVLTTILKSYSPVNTDINK